MYRTTIHIRFSSVVYNTPKRSDVQGSVIIRIQNINFAVLICTLKNLVSAFANMLAARTRLTCVRGFYNYQFNTIKQRLVFKEFSQLSEVPTSKFCSKLFVSPFRSKPNVGQIFNSNAFTLFFGRLYVPRIGARLCWRLFVVSGIYFLYPVFHLFIIFTSK